MKKLAYIGMTLAAFAAVQAHAQSNSFAGFSVTGQAEFDGATSSASDGTSDSARSSGVGIQAKYDWALNKKFVLGLGVSASSGNRQAGTYQSGNSVYSNDRYSLDLEPGYAVNQNVLVYGKLSSVSASVAGDDGASSTTVQGVGYGIGVRSLIDRNLFWQVGLDNYHLNDASFATTGTVSSVQGNVLSLGVGYKF